MRFVKEYANYQIGTVKTIARTFPGGWVAENKAKLISEIKGALRAYDRGLITPTEALREMMRVFEDEYRHTKTEQRSTK